MEKTNDNRVQIGVVVLPNVKRAIAELASTSGRAISNMTERLLLDHPDVQRKVAEIEAELVAAKTV